jgi:hypothetical protein
MNRRDALRTAGLLVGGALALSSGILACSSDARQASTSGVLSRSDQDLIEEIADTLLPTTAASPGAKAANVGPAINLILTDCYKADDQQRVVKGLEAFRATCRERRGGEFASLSRADRESVLREIDAEARKPGASHYYPLFAELARGAYFSSEIGLTRALRYTLSPGRWDGCVPLAPGQPAWG